MDGLREAQAGPFTHNRDQPSMYIHYGPMFSYYAAKTRACLSYKRIPFVEVVEAGAYAERIAPVLGRTVFPVVQSDAGEIFQDTTVIVDELESRHPERPVFPRDPVLMLVTRIVEFFIDEFWIVTAMHTRWNDADARRFAIAEFKRFFGEGGGQDIWSSGAAIAQRMQSYLPTLGIDTQKGRHDMQRLFEEATELLNQAVGPRQFAFGLRPSLVDCCLFEGYFAHQYRDHGSAQAYLKSRAASLSYFLDNMQAAGGMPAGEDMGLTDAFLAYLRYIGPIGAAYAASVRRLAEPLVAAAAPGEALAQPLEPEIELFGRPYKRGCTIFSAWKAQRVEDAHAGLADRDRERADRLMAQIGWSDFLASPTLTRIDRVGFELQRCA